MGLFDSVFAPNTGWLGIPQQDQQPDQQSVMDKLGLLFSDPFGKSQPFAGGLMSPGSDLNRFSQLFTDPFGSQNPFPGALGARQQGGPSTNPADYAGLADAFGGSGPTGNMPPLGAPRTIAPSPTDNTPSLPMGQPSGPSLDQRAYGMPGQPQQITPQIQPQAAQSMAQAQMPGQQDPGIGGRLQAGFANLESGGNPISALANVIQGFATGQRTDRRGVAQQNQAQMAQAVYGALVQRGIPHEQAVGIAQAASTDPKIAEQLLPQALGLKPPSTMEGVIAEQAYNANRGRNSAGAAPNSMATYEDFIRRKSAAEKAGTTEGERVANAQLDLPSAVAQANEALRLTNELKTHKGREGNVWWHTKAGAYLPDSSIPGNTDARDAIGVLNQIKGGGFLEAFKALKGGGAITEIEGKKATDAIARMDRSQSKAEFDRALSDYEGIMKLGIDRANQLAGKNPPNNFQGNSGWQQVKPGVRIRQVQ